MKNTRAPKKNNPTVILDKVVFGTTSPYPTVVIVIRIKYKAVSNVKLYPVLKFIPN